MKAPNSTSLFQIGTLGLAVLMAGCSSVTQVTTGALHATGYLTPQQAASINRSAVALEKTFKDITPEQEYYIGRSVAATILTTKPEADASVWKTEATIPGLARLGVRVRRTVGASPLLHPTVTIGSPARNT